MGRFLLHLPVTVLSYLSTGIDAGQGLDAQAVDGAPPSEVPPVDAGGLAGEGTGGTGAPALAGRGVASPVAPSPAALAAVVRPLPVVPLTRQPTVLAAGPCVAEETAHYRVTFGILGQVAEAELSLSPELAASVGKAPPSLLVRTRGKGTGDVLGFGKTAKRIEADFDARALVARRWSNVKTSSGKTTSDTAEQVRPGALKLLRKRTGEPDLAEGFDRAVPVLDPLGFLMRLRLALPAEPAVYEVLDGRALWLANVSAARLEQTAPGLLRVDGKLLPIYWNGDPDKRRSTFAFSLFFTRDRFRTPVRLTVPYGLGEVRAELVHVERRPGDLGKPPNMDLSCNRSRHPAFWLDFLQRWSARSAALPGRPHTRP